MTDAEYLDTSLFLDDLYEFHRDWFEALSVQDLNALDDYFGVVSQPEDVWVWRDQHCAVRQELEADALEAWKKLRAENGMDGSLF